MTTATTLKAGFLYSQYLLWRGEAESGEAELGWSRGFHLAIQVAQLAEALKTIPPTTHPYVAKVVAILKVAGLTRALAAWLYYELAPFPPTDDVYKGNGTTSDIFQAYCDIFDKVARPLFNACFIAATIFTLYKMPADPEDFSLVLAIFCIGLHRFCELKIPSLLKSNNFKIVHTLFTFLFSTRLSVFLPLLEEWVFQKIHSDCKTKCIELAVSNHNLQRVNQSLRESVNALVQQRLNAERQRQARLQEHSTSPTNIEQLTNYYVWGVQSLIRFIDIPPAIVTNKESAALKELRNNLIVDGYLLFGYFAVIEEALKFDPLSSSNNEREPWIGPLHKQLQDLNPIVLNKLKLLILTGRKASQKLKTLRNDIIKVSGIYTGTYPEGGPPKDQRHPTIPSLAGSAIELLL